MRMPYFCFFFWFCTEFFAFFLFCTNFLKKKISACQDIQEMKWEGEESKKLAKEKEGLGELTDHVNLKLTLLNFILFLDLQGERECDQYAITYCATLIISQKKPYFYKLS